MAADLSFAGGWRENFGACSKLGLAFFVGSGNTEVAGFSELPSGSASFVLVDAGGKNDVVVEVVGLAVGSSPELDSDVVVAGAKGEGEEVAGVEEGGLVSKRLGWLIPGAAKGDG